MERGVRFVQLFNGAKLRTDVDDWDAHGNLVNNHTAHAREIDKPEAGLIRDLKQRGLLGEMLLGDVAHRIRPPANFHRRAWGAMSLWMAGAGIRRRPGHRIIIPQLVS